MYKRWFGAVFVVFGLGFAMNAMAMDAAAKQMMKDPQVVSSDWQWKEDKYGWKYILPDGTYKKNTWEKINGNWYYFQRDGIPATDWTRIKGYDYCFNGTGEQLLGWCYNDEEEKWQYYKEDGTLQKGWYQDQEGNWYWFSNKGLMVSSGYKNILGKRYYFFDNGQLAANQYVGLSYMDENGIRNREYDILRKGKKKVSSISEDTKETLSEASKNLPRSWVKKFNQDGWEILYYTDKYYFSAPMTGSGVYYMCHQLDTNYKKIKICSPQELTEAFCEYIGYKSGCYKPNSKAMTDLFMNRALIDSFIDIPDYYENDARFYFGKVAGSYLLSDENRLEMEKAAPEVTEILKTILYGESD
ncbi:cell wall-binding protein [Clostridium sp. E02]|uniref:N-acetylmuramoyl-L-alanine amidase family protein n=1 Tax=Clostridium sp. E02 TaxID=2487134 RepID=UPI001FAB104C|nr:cell wall-binding protein [Clostridium sp. E02]